MSNHIPVSRNIIFTNSSPNPVVDNRVINGRRVSHGVSTAWHIQVEALRNRTIEDRTVMRNNMNYI